MTAPKLITSRLYGLSNVAVTTYPDSIASELMWAIEKGYTKSRCIQYMSSFIETILRSTIENTHVGNIGRYGPDGDPELLVTMATIAMDDAVNSGDVDANARALVEDNYDRFKAASGAGASPSVRGNSKSKRSVSKSTKKPQPRKGAKR